jgi:hypothetical protein
MTSLRSEGRAKWPLVLLVSIAVGGAACHGSPQPTSGGSAPLAGLLPQTFQLTVADGDVDTRFVTRDHFMAAVEMQLSGEPFASVMTWTPFAPQGRNLALYSRDHIPPDLYFTEDPAVNPPGTAPTSLTGIPDPPGFSSGVESYEYSKQPMNNVNLESGAGTSILFGPLVNPEGETGEAALALERDWVQTLGIASNGITRFVHSEVTPDPVTPRWAKGANPLGWPGVWPTLQPFSSFDPSISNATSSVAEQCSISSDDDPGAVGAVNCDDYECDYTQLHLPNRDAQVDKTIDPGSTGWAAWKASLWVLNYLQVMHDSQENPINTVPEEQLALVGTPENTVLGSGGAGSPALPGTFLGSSDIEGFQAGMFINMQNNQTEQWLKQLATKDGKTWAAFPSILAALTYSTSSPLQWFPGSVGVTEDSKDASGFPRPTSYAILSADSHLLDLAGMLGAYSSMYALTDHANTQTGGSQPARAYFDGSPFQDDNQLPDGEPTTHDRMLAMVRVLVVNILRIHWDPASGLFADDATFTGGKLVQGDVLSPDVAAYALLALRTARRSLDSVLTLYSNTTPDIEGAPCLLDSFPSLDGKPFSTKLDELIVALANAFYDRFTLESGLAYAGWNLGADMPTDTGTSLDAHTAAVRGLLLAYLATGNTKFRDRGLAVFQRIESAFYDPAARIYRPAAFNTSNRVTFTPRRFGLLQAAMRDIYELIAVNEGYETLATEIVDPQVGRLGRLNKLVLNGWDDRDQDEQVMWPDECVHYHTNYNGPGSDMSVAMFGEGHVLALGGLQMAERTLTGEVGSFYDVPIPGAARIITTDREQDCVPEISAVKLPSALANSITFTLSPYQP